MDNTFSLFRVAVYNPKTGEILVSETTVSATSKKSAENKAVALLAGELGQDQSLDTVLDEVEVVASPF